jgi:ERCC4-type nuclease
MIHVIARMRDLCENVRRSICFNRSIDPYKDDIDAMCALLDDGDILNTIEAVLAPEHEPPTILVDTREQRPFAPFLWQKGKRIYLPVERFMLSEGDYSAMGLQTFIRIERKSVGDLYGSLFGTSCDAMGESAPNQARLRAEFLRLQKYPRRYFVIEGHQRDLVEYIRRSERRVDASAAIQLVESMGFDYDVPVRWCTNRESAEWFVGYVLSRAHTQATGAAEAKKAAKRGLSLPWAYDIEKAVKRAADAIREGAAP